MSASITSKWTFLLLQCHKSPQKCLLSLSLDKKLFHVVVQLLTEPLRGGGGGEFVRLMKMPFWPTYNFVRSALFLPVAAPGRHQIWTSAVKTEDDSFTPSSNRTSSTCWPGNPRWPSICSAICLTAGGDELEVSPQATFQRHQLVSLILLQELSKNSVSFACLCGVEAINSINGDKDANFLIVCPWRHSRCCTQLFTQTVKELVKRQVQTCLLPHLRNIWPIAECLFVGISGTVWWHHHPP